MAQLSSTTAVLAAVFLVALVVAAASSLPTASAFGCYDDCYQRCANGKDDPACKSMCNEACAADKAPAGEPNPAN